MTLSSVAPHEEGLSLLSCPLSWATAALFCTFLHLPEGGWWGPSEVVSFLRPPACLSSAGVFLSAVNFFLSLGRAYFITKEAYEGDKIILICSTGYGSLSLTTGLCWASFVILERSFNTAHLKLQACLIKEIWISYQAFMKRGWEHHPWKLRMCVFCSLKCGRYAKKCKQNPRKLPSW